MTRNEGGDSKHTCSDRQMFGMTLLCWKDIFSSVTQGKFENAVKSLYFILSLPKWA